MNISYDATVDAVYIKLIPGRHRVQAREVDDDIVLNLDESDRLVGIEVLDASKRLDLRSLLPVKGARVTGRRKLVLTPAMVSGDGWDRLRRELVRLKESNTPIETTERHRKNWVEEVGEDYVIVKRDTGNTQKITRNEFEGRTKWELSITRALRQLAS